MCRKISSVRQFYTLAVRLATPGLNKVWNGMQWSISFENPNFISVEAILEIKFDKSRYRSLRSECERLVAVLDEDDIDEFTLPRGDWKARPFYTEQIYHESNGLWYHLLRSTPVIHLTEDDLPTSLWHDYSAFWRRVNAVNSAVNSVVTLRSFKIHDLIGVPDLAVQVSTGIAEAQEVLVDNRYSDLDADWADLRDRLLDYMGLARDLGLKSVISPNWTLPS
jgi:hypothetical protein